tara:strand:- start:61 stop:927 length:867 start_codon:yes stop_codon:yes gene_type:complete
MNEWFPRFPRKEYLRWGKVIHPVTNIVAYIEILGTGNAFCPPGRMHALVLIDGKILIDAPPTIMPQLRRQGAQVREIEHTLFTHWHADHTFGFPFFLLDRKYISDSNREFPLSVYVRPGGKEVLSELCRVGFPGSLEDALEGIIWVEEEECELKGTDWKFIRFPVCHTPETDPHGYEMVHSSGFRLLHCGDSGPCEEIEKRAKNADAVILEMGMPDIGEFPHHHRPSDVESFNYRFPDVKVFVTHNYARSENENEGFLMAKLSPDITQLEDEDKIEIDKDGILTVIKK